MLRPYQIEAIFSVRKRWERRVGTVAVCLVAPTGSGKTVMGTSLIEHAPTALWVAHRRDLVKQTALRLGERFGRRVGIIMPGERENRDASIHVGTIQTLLARKRPLPADHLVLDEAHHYVSTEWAQIRKAYPKARVLGLTATPERADGKPLGDVFGELVVAASYSQLIKDGFLVPARVHRPRMNLGNDLAQDPFDAWRKFSEGSRTFIFCARTSIARNVAQKFRNAGVVAQVIEASTPKREREETLDLFHRGKVRVIVNVGTMTEGIDVPEARTVILMRAFNFVGGYLQVVGRVLRPAKDKPDAILIDLVGASITHGLPTDDREYSLSGKAISGQSFGGGGIAPTFTQEVRDMELVTIARGAALVDVEAPVPNISNVAIDNGVRRTEFDRLLRLVLDSKLPMGLASRRYYETFGEWPKKEWS